MSDQGSFRFDGSDYDRKLDDVRLTKQIRRVFSAMLVDRWMTLGEIEQITKDPPASISAQLRHLRKKRFGAHAILKQRRGEPEHGLWEYKLVVNRDSNIILV